MKRALIITSAGCSRRFSSSLGKDVLKVLYSEGKPKECLLGLQLELIKHEEIDTIIVVGGYAFSELCEFIKQNYSQDRRIKIVYNSKFNKYGTCYSFACGVKALGVDDFDEVIFMEGDLVFDAATFADVVSASRDVITLSPAIVSADQSVIFYVTPKGVLHYLYDTQHKLLQVRAAFKKLGNSGQLWKFCDVKLLKNVIKKMGKGLCEDTNLRPIEQYFNLRGIDETEFIVFRFWVNCNTLNDYKVIRKNQKKLYAKY